MTQPHAKRILLAEDDGSMRSFLDLMLQRAGYDVVACADGVEALSFLEDFGEVKRCDLLLTDVVMP
ncbi:MAG: response regulator, partial [Bdellovibrionales bacterium]